MRYAAFALIVYVVGALLFYQWPKWWRGNFVSWQNLFDRRQRAMREIRKDWVEAHPSSEEMSAADMAMVLRLVVTITWPRVLVSGIATRTRLHLRAARVARFRRRAAP